MYYSFSVSFRIPGLLKDPKIQEKIQLFATNLERSRNLSSQHVTGLTLIPESFVIYFTPDTETNIEHPQTITATTLQDMFLHWSNSIQLKQGKCPAISGSNTSALIQPFSLDTSVRANLCIRNWIKKNYPKIWQALSTSSSLVPEKEKQKEHEQEQEKEQEKEYSLIKNGIEVETELEPEQTPQTKTKTKQLSQVISLFYSTITENEYSKFVKEYENLTQTLSSILTKSQQLQQPPKQFLSDQFLQDLQLKIKRYNAYCTGYQLLTPHLTSIKRFLYQQQQQQQREILYPSPEVGTFFQTQIEKSANILHQSNPFQISLVNALESEKQSLLTVLNSFRFSFGKWKAQQQHQRRKLLDIDSKSVFEELPIKLEMDPNFRLRSYQIGKYSSSLKLPSCVPIPLFVPFSIEWQQNSSFLPKPEHEEGYDYRSILQETKETETTEFEQEYNPKRIEKAQNEISTESNFSYLKLLQSTKTPSRLASRKILRLYY
jgi:hypothetical protein